MIDFLYDLVRGPLVWIAFALFILGSVYRLFTMYNMAKKEKVVFPYMDFKFGMRSIFHWMIPYASMNMRMRPFFTAMSFLFHICLFLTPIFVFAHIALWNINWGISWWYISDSIANIMTILVVIIGIGFLFRRIADPMVRKISTYKDYVFNLAVLSPFIFGLLAYYHVFNAEKTIETLHILSGCIWLGMIPFTRASHMIFFPFTRAYMGGEFGLVRKSKDW